MDKFVLLRFSELGDKKYDRYEKPLFFDSYFDAELEFIKWQDYLEQYPANGGGYIAELLDCTNDYSKD